MVAGKACTPNRGFQLYYLQSDPASLGPLISARRTALGSLWRRVFLPPKSLDDGHRYKPRERIALGACFSSRHPLLVSEMPHGRLKASAYGKDLSMYALEDYTVPRHVMVKL